MTKTCQKTVCKLSIFSEVFMKIPDSPSELHRLNIKGKIKDLNKKYADLKFRAFQ